MKKQISASYQICVCLAVIFFIYMYQHARNEIFSTKGGERHTVLEGHSYTTVQDSAAPSGVREVYVIHADEIPEESDAFVFRSIHQNVKVFIEDRLVFSLKKDTSSSFGRTPGCRWNTVKLTLGDQGSDIRVEIEPVYHIVAGVTPAFYIGSRFTIYMSIVRQDYPSALLCVFAIVLGVGLIVFTAFGYRNMELDKNLFMIGQSAVLLGIWKMSDTDLFGLIFRREEAISYLPYLALMLLAVPFVQYIRNLFSNSGHWIWDFVGIFNIGVFLVSIALQVAGIADLKEMLWLNHVSLFTVFFAIFYMLFKEVHINGWDGRLKMIAACTCACMAGFGSDILTYYLSSGVVVQNIGMFCFLVFILALGVMSLRDANKLMSIGLKAKKYKQLAYHDQLTGLYNRAAYSADITKADFVSKDSIIIMFDLNDLKHCNDTYGHDKGDLYITSCAALIRQVFGNAGRCYRVGGDEFCVLIQDMEESECGKLIGQLKEEAEKWNASHQEPFSLQIAAGFATYDRMVDYDIGDTRRRADKMMYMDKYNMKQRVLHNLQYHAERT